MPSGRSFYQRSPERYATEKQEFQRLVTDLKRLVSKKGYSQKRIASEMGVSPMTVNYWCTGHSLTAKSESVERLKKFLSAHA
jgi:predicted transcriptional regulator